jgi:hypothetical protein
LNVIVSIPLLLIHWGHQTLHANFLKALILSSVPGCVDKKPPPLSPPEVRVSHVNVSIITSFGITSSTQDLDTVTVRLPQIGVTALLPGIERFEQNHADVETRCMATMSPASSCLTGRSAPALYFDLKLILTREGLPSTIRQV